MTVFVVQGYINVTLDLKTSHKVQFIKMEVYT